MDNRPRKSRPSNVIIYVLLSLAGLFGLFIFGKILQSFDQESGILRQYPSTDIATLNYQSNA